MKRKGRANKKKKNERNEVLMFVLRVKRLLDGVFVPHVDQDFFFLFFFFG